MRAGSVGVNPIDHCRWLASRTVAEPMPHQPTWLGCNGARFAFHVAVTHCLIQSNLLPLVLFTQSPGRTPSSVGITLELCSHVLPGMQEDAAAKVDATIRAALDKA